MRMAFLVPTRGRPANAERLACRWVDSAQADTHLIFFVDDDDPARPEYERVLDPFGTEQVTLMIDERRRVGPTLNYWAPKFATSYEAIGFMGDDHLPQSPSWDRNFATLLGRQRHAIVYGDDLFQRQNLPTAVVMDAAIIRRLGFMVPPGLIHLYLDNFWRDLGNALGTLVFSPSIVIEHMHPQAQKAEWDNGYREVNGGAMWEADTETYRAFVDSGRLTDAAELLRTEVAG